VVALQIRRWLLRSGHGWVLVLFVSFVLIYLSQALSITRVARFLDCSGFISFMGFVLVGFYLLDFIHNIMGHHTCSVFATPGV
jgi:hypothetical protein